MTEVTSVLATFINMKWIRVEAGEYWSNDNRFNIIKTWDRIYNSHWRLYDRVSNKDYPCDSLKECKQKAENIIIKS